MDIVAALALTATLFLEFRRDKMNGTEKTKNARRHTSQNARMKNQCKDIKIRNV